MSACHALAAAFLAARLCAAPPQSDAGEAPIRLAVEAAHEAPATFVVRGTAGLPDGALLSVELRKGGDPPGPALHVGAAVIRGEAYEFRCVLFEGRPAPPGPYRARVRYDPRFEGDLSVRAALRRMEIARPAEAAADLRLGEPADHARALDEMRFELARTVAAVVRDVRSAAGPRGDAGLEAARAVTETLRRNSGRAEHLYFGLADLAENDLADLCKRALDALERLRGPVEARDAVRRVEALENRAWRILDRLDVPSVAAAAVSERVVARLESWAAAGAADREAVLAGARGDLLELARRVSRGRYPLVASLAESFERWIEESRGGGSAPPPALLDAARELARELLR
jgi:hypothetical protein